MIPSRFIASVSRSTVRATNTDQDFERRQFIRAATGGTALAVLAGCKTVRKTDSSVTVVTQPDSTTVDTTGITSPETSAPPTTDGSIDTAPATMWRLSTRNQRSPCSACKAHGAHRYFVSEAAAEAGRAHAGCVCEIRPQDTTMGTIFEYFGEGGEVFDDRWT